MIKTMVLARTLRFSPLLKNTITKSRQGHSEPSRLRLRRKRGKETQSRPEDEPFIFHPLVRTIQPVSQALRITKTIINEQLPPVITSASKDLPLKEILDQIKQSILPADYFDCPEKSKYDQRSKGLITNVVKAIWSAAERYSMIMLPDYAPFPLPPYYYNPIRKRCTQPVLQIAYCVHPFGYKIEKGSGS